MAVATQPTDDELFARRLQLEELGYAPDADALEGGAAPNADLEQRMNSLQLRHQQLVQVVNQDLPGGDFGADDAPPEAENLDDSLRTRRLLYLYSLFAATQVLVGVVVAAMTWKAECDYQLRTWLLVFISRFAVSYPLQVTKFRRRGLLRPSEKRLENYLQLLTLVWIFLGQSWLTNSHTCKDTAPLLYHTVQVYVVIAYVGIFLPLLFVILVCLCLPCAYVFIKVFGEQQGAPEDVIRHLPTRIFHANENEQQQQQQQQSADKDKAQNKEDATAAATVDDSARSRDNSASSDDSALEMGPLLARSDRERDSSSASASASSNDVKIDIDSKADGSSSNAASASAASAASSASRESNNLQCAICMEDYAEGDQLRILPCAHEFHVKCVDEWLRQKKTCPLCRVRIDRRGVAEDDKQSAAAGAGAGAGAGSSGESAAAAGGSDAAGAASDTLSAAGAAADAPRTPASARNNAPHAATALDDASASAAPLLDRSSAAASSASPSHSSHSSSHMSDRRRAEEARRRILRELGLAV